MLAIAEVPDREFIMMYRTEIEFKLFKNYPDLVRELSGVSKNTNYLTELNKLSQMKMSNGLADKYIKTLFRIGGGLYTAECYSEFRNVRTVDLKSTECNESIALHDYQKEAVEALRTHFIEDDKKAGLFLPRLLLGIFSVSFFSSWIIQNAQELHEREPGTTS